jgi:threonylcarbamoyladenosine tRNA methylthiotransferase MtaB
VPAAGWQWSSYLRGFSPQRHRDTESPRKTTLKLNLAVFGICPGAVFLCVSCGDKFFGLRISRKPEYATIGNVPAYHVENFGCRATQADGAALERQFEERGLARASAAEADVVILNTCTVTAAADQDARAAIRRVRRQNPKAKIVVTGCYAQRAPEEIAALPGVSCVVGNSHKHQLAEIALRSVFAPGKFSKPASGFRPPASGNMASDLGPRTSSFGDTSALDAGGSLPDRIGAFVPLTSLTSGSREPETGSRIFVSDIFAHTEFIAAPVFDAASGRTRPNLKIQDGCDNRCSFCVIPYVRGQSRSLPLPQVLCEVNALVEAGYREVVISGINLGRWGRDLRAASGSRLPAPGFQGLLPEAESRKPEAAFEDLLRAILAETSIEKLRISSVEPMDWTDELIALVAESPRVARHAHVPLQSGSDAVLRRMHRKYRPWHYREKIEKIRAAMPTAAIGADVMVGFPGETDAEFEATRRLIEELPFTYLHVFTYSARPGTPAAALPKQVPVQVARERSRVLRELASEKKLAFMRRFIGKTMDVITLSGSSQSGHSERGISGEVFTEALTDNYLELHIEGHHEPNRWLRAQVDGVRDGVLVGGWQERWS